MAWKEIHDWVDAAKVLTAMRANRVGVLGHYYCGMLDVYSDMTQQSAVFGNHFELIEMCSLHKLREAVTKKQVDVKLAQFRHDFDVAKECEKAELTRAAKTSCALDALVEKNHLGSLAYYYEGEDGNDYRDIATSVIAGNTLLTGRHIPVAGECEIKNVQAMKIMDSASAARSRNFTWATSRTTWCISAMTARRTSQLPRDASAWCRCPFIMANRAKAFRFK